MLTWNKTSALKIQFCVWLHNPSHSVHSLCNLHSVILYTNGWWMWPIKNSTHTDHTNYMHSLTVNAILTKGVFWAKSGFVRHIQILSTRATSQWTTIFLTASASLVIQVILKILPPPLYKPNALKAPFNVITLTLIQWCMICVCYFFSFPNRPGSK